MGLWRRHVFIDYFRPLMRKGARPRELFHAPIVPALPDGLVVVVERRIRGMPLELLCIQIALRHIREEIRLAPVEAPQFPPRIRNDIISRDARRRLLPILPRDDEDVIIYSYCGQPDVRGRPR